MTHCNRLKSLDPTAITLAVTLARGYIDPRKWTEASGLLGTDPYPLYGPEPTQGAAHSLSPMLPGAATVRTKVKVVNGKGVERVHVARPRHRQRRDFGLPEPVVGQFHVAGIGVASLTVRTVL